MCDELVKLCKMLDVRGVKWTDRSDSMISRIRFEVDGKTWSAINGIGTYGGEIGAIELWCLDEDYDEDPIGWLSAENVIAEVIGDYAEGNK